MQPWHRQRWLVAVAWLAASCAHTRPETAPSSAASAGKSAAESATQSPSQAQPLAIARSSQTSAAGATIAGTPAERPAEARPFALARGDAPPDLWKVPERRGTLRRIARRSSMHYTFSPDSSQVLFLSRADGLVAMRPDGKRKRILVGAPPTLAAPAPGNIPPDKSPDEFDGRARTRRPALAQPGSPLFFRVSPNSRSVVYAAREGAGTGLFVIPISGGSPLRLVEGGYPDIGNLIITPDSRWVVLSRIGQGVYVAPLDATMNPRALVGPHPLGLIYHVTPNSRHVVYRGQQHVHSIDLDGTNDRDLTPGLGRTDSMFLVSGGVIVSDDRGSLRVAALDGSGTRQLMPADLSYSWPPRPVAGGHGLAFHDLEFNLYHVNITSNTYRRINRPLQAGEQVSSFYESTSDLIVYSIMRGADSVSREYELYVADINNNTNRLLAVADRTRTVIARPTADQRHVIVHIHTADDRMAFFRIDLITNRIHRLTPFLPGWSNFELSPDSRYLVFGITTKPTQPREIDLHTLELP